jgi:ABC-type nitrate/sulfonate/bicarbonate transport system ATPase subunit
MAQLLTVEGRSIIRSDGYLHRVEERRERALEPKLFLLDEAFSGLDIAIKTRLYMF